jgi:hypothetical protein
MALAGVWQPAELARPAVRRGARTQHEPAGPWPQEPLASLLAVQAADWHSALKGRHLRLPTSRPERARARARLRTSAYACACVCVPRRDACAQRVVLTPPTCLLWGLLSAARGHASIRSRACLRPCNVRKRVTQQLFATLGAHARDGTRWQTVEGQHDVNGQLQRG